MFYRALEMSALSATRVHSMGVGESGKGDGTGRKCVHEVVGALAPSAMRAH